MKFVPIFVSENDCKLWSVCYPEHQVNGKDRDVFNILFEQWSSRHYLKTFLTNHESDLEDPFWYGTGKTDLIDQIEIEREDFITELYAIETKQSGYENMSLRSIFKKLHTNIYSLNFKGDSYRKGKPFISRPILRIYAIELEDETFVVTGGALKLTRTMAGLIFKREFARLDRVKEFLDRNGIMNHQGLIEQ